MVDRLLHGKDANDHRGALEVLAMTGADVVVDGKDLGYAPLPGPVRDLPIGVHRVEVRKDGYLPFGQDVAIAQGETHVVQVDLIDEESTRPWYARWWVWGSVAGAVVVVGGAAAVVGTYAYLSQEAPTQLSVKASLPTAP
jgi:hypothetical protein